MHKGGIMAMLTEAEWLHELGQFFVTPDPGHEPDPERDLSPPDQYPPGEPALACRLLRSGTPPSDVVAMLSPELRARLQQADPDQTPEDARQAQLSQRWTVVGLETLLQPAKRPDFLIDGMIRQPALISVYGVPGDLKTMLCLDLGVSVAGGLPWLAPLPNVGTGGLYIAKQAPVLVLDQDNGIERLQERFGALLRSRDVTQAPVHAISLPRPLFDASKPEDADLLAAQIDALDVGLCLIDNLGTVSGGRDENSSQMVDVMANLRWIAEATHCTVIIIHHARKSTGAGGREGDRLRGHSSIEASLDLALLVERSDDDLTIKSTKTRDNPVKPFVTRWTYDQTDFGALHKARFWHICTTAPVVAEYARIGGELPDLLEEFLAPLNQNQLVKKIEGVYGIRGRQTSLDAIKYAIDKGTIIAERQGDYRTAPILYKKRN